MMDMNLSKNVQFASLYGHSHPKSNDIRDFGRPTFMHGTWIGPMNHDHVVGELLVRPGGSPF